jgi:hypothetical protein
MGHGFFSLVCIFKAEEFVKSPTIPTTIRQIFEFTQIATVLSFNPKNMQYRESDYQKE